MRNFGLLTLQGVMDVFRQPWALTLTLAAIVLVTIMGGSFLMVMHNLELQLNRHRGSVQFQVYWRPGTEQTLVQADWEALRGLEGLKSLKTFTPDQALEVLSESLGAAQDKGLGGAANPLPATALADFDVPDPDVQAWGKAMYGRLSTMPQVAEVHFNPVQLDTLSSWVTMVRRVFWPSLVFLALVAALAVGNTIKLSLVRRREEVDILRLVGAGRWYIQYPLLIGGAVQGFLGGILALGALKGLQIAMARALDFPPLWMRIEFLPPEQALALIGGLVLTGMAGSLVALGE
ncbi:MAG: FtsX-like permease family protein [Deltaproteobacteria bacterium]|nr:FtsX-like permease family protein [Deltaproteobacteria bacterium]